MDEPRHQETPESNASLVVVLKTGEAGLLPLVRIALEQEGIEYTVRNSGLSEYIIGSRTTSMVGNSTPPFEVVVREQDADKARQLLADLAKGLDKTETTPELDNPELGDLEN